VTQHAIISPFALLTVARFMEDDFELCANGMMALQHAVAKAHSCVPSYTRSEPRFVFNYLIAATSANGHLFDLGGKLLRDASLM
jgi:hypothetical protein